MMRIQDNEVLTLPVANSRSSLRTEELMFYIQGPACKFISVQTQ